MNLKVRDGHAHVITGNGNRVETCTNKTTSLQVPDIKGGFIIRVFGPMRMDIQMKISLKKKVR